MTQYEGNCDTVWFWGRGFMRFAEGRYGLCGGALGLSAHVAETATVRGEDSDLRFAYKWSGDRFSVAGAGRPRPEWRARLIF